MFMHVSSRAVVYSADVCVANTSFRWIVTLSLHFPRQRNNHLPFTVFGCCKASNQRLGFDTMVGETVIFNVAIILRKNR